MIRLLLADDEDLLRSALASLLALEELFSGSPLLGAYSLHWQLPVGIILLAVVLFAPWGIAGAFAKRRR